MFRRRELEWIPGRFGDYDLVYLDPLVCNRDLYPGWFGRLPARYLRRGTVEGFFARLARTLRVNPEEPWPQTYLRNDGIGERSRDDRALQRRVVAEIEKNWPSDTRRHFSNVAALRANGSILSTIADKPHGEGLVMLDGMFASRATVAEPIAYTVEEPIQYRSGSLRSIECILSDVPAPTLTLDQPIVGLRVDPSVALNWSEPLTSLISRGWHPFARVIGLYTTTAGGRGFIDVIAILMRAHPSLDMVLKPWGGQMPRHCLPGMLNYQQRNFLDRETARLEALSTAIDAGKAMAPTGPYNMDSEFLYPVHFTVLFCRLNNVCWQGLKARAAETYTALANYLTGLKKLADLLNKLGMPSLITPLEKQITLLLPDT